MLKVGEVVDRPIARRTTVGERWIVRKVHDAAVERVGIAGAWHLDVEERSDARDKPERTMLAKSEVHRAPTPSRWVGAMTALELGHRRPERPGDEAVARLMLWRRAVVAPVPARGAALQQSRQRQGTRGEEALERCAEVVAINRPDRLALPRHEDERLAEVSAHVAIPTLQTVEASPIHTARAPSGRDHQGLQTGEGE